MTDVHVPVAPGRSMRTYLALPDGEGPRAAVIVIHEVFGLNDDIREKVDRFAAMGYVALAPDLYDGRGPKPFCVVRTMRALGRGRGGAFDDLEAARRWLVARPEVDPSRVGVTGFCMGGGFALLFAARAQVGAVAAFYGAVPKDMARLDGICPVLGGYGGEDRVFRSHVPRLERYLTDSGVDHDVMVYPEAGHSYMNHHTGLAAKLSRWGPMKVGFDAAAADDSWRRIETFFRRHLGPASA